MLRYEIKWVFFSLSNLTSVPNCPTPNGRLIQNYIMHISFHLSNSLMDNYFVLPPYYTLIFFQVNLSRTSQESQSRVCGAGVSLSHKHTHTHTHRGKSSADWVCVFESRQGMLYASDFMQSHVLLMQFYF